MVCFHLAGRHFASGEIRIMVFRSLFGGGRRTEVLNERASLFREAWLLANRAILAATMDWESPTADSSEMSPVQLARQWIRDEKISFSSDALQTELLTDQLLKWAEKVHRLSSHFSLEADVSSAHSMTAQRILEVVGGRLRAGEPLDVKPTLDEFTEKENEILAGVLKSCHDYWQSAD